MRTPHTGPRLRACTLSIAVHVAHTPLFFTAFESQRAPIRNHVPEALIKYDADEREAVQRGPGDAGEQLLPPHPRHARVVQLFTAGCELRGHRPAAGGHVFPTVVNGMPKSPRVPLMALSLPNRLSHICRCPGSAG